jgi:hypothetical protein
VSRNRKERPFGVLLVTARGNHSQELGHRSRTLVDQLGGAVQAHEIEDVEQRISIAVKKNKLLQSQRPDELIKRTVGSRPLRMAI